MEAKMDTTVDNPQVVNNAANPVSRQSLLHRLNQMAAINKKLLERLDEQNEGIHLHASKPAEKSPIQKQNELLLQRLEALEQANKELLANQHKTVEKSPMEKQNERLKQRLKELEQANKLLTTKKTPSPRRSPRNKKRASPPRKTPTKTKKKKLFEPKKKRTPKPKKAQKIRKTLGDTFKKTYDKQLQAGRFKDSENRFKLDLFDDCVRPIIQALQEDEEIDTTGYSYSQLYKIAKDAVKKRARYTPV